MMYFACKDAGVDCNFVATGESVEGVNKAAFAYAKVVHKDILQKLKTEQQNVLAKIVQTNIKPK